MPRTSNTELPTATELWEILDKESQRFSMRYDFLDLHPGIFKAYSSICGLYNLDCGWIDSYRDIGLQDLTARIFETTDRLEELLLTNPPGAALLDGLYDTLDTSTHPTHTDAIFVFGSPSNLRIEKAIELYRAGYADKLILSGHGPHYGDHTVTEADRMCEYAVSKGIPVDAIAIENKSVTIPDNVKRTLDLFEGSHNWPKSLIVVASPFVLRRCEMEWFKFSPKPIQIIPVASTIMSPELNREGWAKSAHGIRAVLNEYAKLVIESKMDLLRAAMGDINTESMAVTNESTV